MANYLLTGARAPVTLELATNLKKYGHTVYLADSLRYPIAKTSTAITDYWQIPAPQYQFAAFCQAIITIILRYKIDYLIPTCEETFYLAKLKQNLARTPKLIQHCYILCPPLPLLKALHSKLTIIELATKCGIALPSTSRLSKTQLLAKLSLQGWVIKSEYSRFGTDILIEPNAKQLHKFITQRSNSHYILQQKITGTEYCSYSIAHNGQLSLHISYQPKYRINHSAAIFFQPIVDQQITDFVSQFVKKHHYTRYLSKCVFLVLLIVVLSRHHFQGIVALWLEMITPIRQRGAVS